MPTFRMGPMAHKAKREPQPTAWVNRAEPAKAAKRFGAVLPSVQREKKACFCTATMLAVLWQQRRLSLSARGVGRTGGWYSCGFAYRATPQRPMRSYGHSPVPLRVERPRLPWAGESCSPSAGAACERGSVRAWERACVVAWGSCQTQHTKHVYVAAAVTGWRLRSAAAPEKDAFYYPGFFPTASANLATTGVGRTVPSIL